jgi:CubicO group peptidase (beta-lactamase class C family)
MPDNTNWIEVSTPEEQGIPSHAILWFLDHVEKESLDLHSLQIIRNGKMVVDAVAKPFTHDSYHRIFSAAKGIVATAMLFAIQDGYFTFEDKVISLIPKEYLPEKLDPKWTDFTVFQLLTMNSGHNEDTFFKMWGKSDHWIKTFFEVSPAYRPGTYFCYDMGAQYVMNEMIRIHTGKDTGEFLKGKLFDKLGIEYQVNYTKPEGIFFSSTIQLKPDSMAKLALFYLQEGEWNGEQVLRRDLAGMIGRRYSPSRHYEYVRSGQFDNIGGYGLHVWRNELGGYRFAGGQGQFAIVIPEENLAIGIMAAEHRSNRILDLLMEALYSEMYRYPVAVSEDDSRDLTRILENWNLAPRDVSDRSSAEKIYSGKVFQMRENPTNTQSVKFDFSEKETYITVLQDGKEKRFRCGLNGNWVENHEGYLLMQSSPYKIADLDRIFHFNPNDTVLSGGWRSETKFEFTLRSKSLLCGFTFECEFADNELIITRPFNDYMNRTELRDPKFEDPKQKLRGFTE